MGSRLENNKDHFVGEKLHYVKRLEEEKNFSKKIVPQNNGFEKDLWTIIFDGPGPDGLSFEVTNRVDPFAADKGIASNM